MSNGTPRNVPASNQPLLPPGWTIARNRWAGTGKRTVTQWRAYHHGRPRRDFTGPGARKDATAYCWAQYRARQQESAEYHASSGDDDEVLAVLRAAREEAQGVVR